MKSVTFRLNFVVSDVSKCLVISIYVCLTFKCECMYLFDWQSNVGIKSSCELNYHDQKIRRTPTHDIWEHWTAVSTLLGFISSVYRNLHHWRSNQRPQIAVPKLYNWATSSYHTQVIPNQLVTAIARLINLNVSCKLHPYSFLIRLKQLSSVPICRAQVFARFFGRDNSIHNINSST